VASNAEYCTPGVVPNISITSDKVLHWSNASNPYNCSIDGYIIDIFDPEDGAQLQFHVDALTLIYDVSVLDMCKTYSFEVRAITDKSVIGPSERINATIPPSTNLNLALKVNNDSLLVDDRIYLTWKPVDSAVARCISYYRVVYWDERNSPADVYTSMNRAVIVENPVPCMAYTFQVSAVVINPDNVGPSTEVSWPGYSAVPKPPKLINIISGDTTVNMTWEISKYTENRCELISLVLNTLGLPPSASSTIIPIQDGVTRPNVYVYLENLTPNYVYTSSVALQNSAGYSKNVTVTFQTSDNFVFDYRRDVIY
jgi:hypothetical protein